MRDVIVIGLGAMGSAAAWQLARRGAGVLGLERFAEGHGRGSSHGRTRVIRRVYSEGAVYMPLLDRAYALWDSMEAESGKTFLLRTGGLDIAPAGAPSLANSVSCASARAIAHEILDAREIRSRWPRISVPDGYEAVFAPDSGQLLSDAAGRWMRDAARASGADLRFDTEVTGWRRSGDHIMVETASGTETARRLVIAAGAWVGTLLPALDPALAVERQVVGWFGPVEGDLPALPVFQVEPEHGGRYYIQPGRDGAATKIGLYGHRGERGPDMREGRAPDGEDEALQRAGLDRWLPSANGKLDSLQECRFTRTRDDRFIIGHWPGDEAITVLSPCSGHGFKFAPAVGEAAAALALGEEPPVDLTPFSVTRYL